MKLATRAVMSVEVLSYVGVCIVSVNVCVNVSVNVCRCGCEENGYMWWHVAFVWYKITHFSWNNRFGTTFFEKKSNLLKKNRKSFGQFAKKFYLCTRKRKTTTVRWMRGLVNGLQNRVHPFESGTHL